MTAAPETVPRWVPKHDAAALADILAKAKAWQPLVVARIFEDLDLALESPQPPSAKDLTALLDRLREHFKRLRDIAVSDPKFPPSDELEAVIEQGTPLYEAETPAGYRSALGLARRLGYTVHDLLDELITSLQDTE
ncbi:DUF6415 family natural product biosynthesis protein [Streptomyces sp. G44]|uniref:DUF6415 family natural product biosynthesis protein n=1 Tax=Streptomyces sp. G44 TaxID=2807632 RepID=UPI0027DB2399|nr:DUF6415 family natural product biosynthesis protein [Streptomyces sp. G44]